MRLYRNDHGGKTWHEKKHIGDAHCTADAAAASASVAVAAAHDDDDDDDDDDKQQQQRKSCKLIHSWIASGM